MAGRLEGSTDSIAISVHGSAGVLDLVVPGGATVWDVAREYAERAGSATIPIIYTRGGAALLPDRVLADEGLESGDLLVASAGALRVGPPRRARPRHDSERCPAGPAAAAFVAAAATAGVLAGGLAAVSGSTWTSAPVAVLLLAAAVGVVPGGRLTTHRALAAPAFAGAAAFAVHWDPTPERLPALVGLTGLAAAVTAAVARALDDRASEGLRVWIVAGSLLFVLGAGTTLLGWPVPLVWSLLTVLATLAARFVPLLAVDVPDQYLLDFERLAVNAWSAREQPRNRRGQMLVSLRRVADVADAATRTVAAASAAVMASVLVGSRLLLSSVTDPTDRLGARLLVFFCGASLLLVARSYRHASARSFLRLGGLAAWAVLGLALVSELSSVRLLVIALVCALAAAGLVVAAVATGRGWRSAAWARRAELAESLCGAAAVAAVLVSSGLFRALLELTSRNAP